MNVTEKAYGLILYAPGAESLLLRVVEATRWAIKMSDHLSPQKTAVLIRELVAEAEREGWEGNLWQCVLTKELLCSENPYSLACEGRGDPGGALSRLAQRDLAVFRLLFTWEFGKLQQAPGGSNLDLLLHYDLGNREKKAVSSSAALLCRQRDRLAAAENDNAFAAAVSEYYRDIGAGVFALDRAFRLSPAGELLPLRGMREARLSDLVGYELQKRQLTENTAAFLAARESNNVLLYGDAGTGKSTCVRALLNEYPDSMLRIIEIQKPQFHFLPELIERLRHRNYRFILFIDDLSFEEHETEYKHLKAVIEGGLLPLPENLRIYATSNRRHIVREVWNDRNDMEHDGDVHRSDTLEEKLSLSGRFGVSINFSAPDRQLYHAIVRALAKRQLPVLPEDDALILGANAWEIRHGGVSGRTAQQYIDDLAGKAKGT